jgi:hypothetical protein
MNIAWHYWCGTKNHADRYVKYLLISVDSLIHVGKIKPQNIYVTIEEKILNSTYGMALKKIGINTIQAPIYPNYSKQISYHKLIQSNIDIDKLVQIDCDTIVTDPNILDKISKLKGCLNIDRSGHINLYDTIVRRDGQKQKGNHVFSVCPVNSNPPHSGDPIKYASFKDFISILYNIDFDDFLEYSKSEMLPIGFCYVLSPKELPNDFFKFLSLVNFFFEDDEMAIVLAKYYFKLTYSEMNSDHMSRNNPDNLIFNADDLSCFGKFRGIVHFPNKDDLIDEEMTKMANLIVDKL